MSPRLENRHLGRSADSPLVHFSLKNFFITAWILLGHFLFCNSDAGFGVDVYGCHTAWMKVDSFSNFDFLLVQKVCDVWQTRASSQTSPIWCHGNWTYHVAPGGLNLIECQQPLSVLVQPCYCKPVFVANEYIKINSFALPFVCLACIYLFWLSFGW